MAGKLLAEAGLQVTILEARERIGGRIHTVDNIEYGAEFVHGKLPLTLALLKEAGIKKRKIQGRYLQFNQGKWKEGSDFFANVDLIKQQLMLLQEDMSIADFLKKHFSKKKYAALRRSLTGYIEGYYAGDIEKCSARAFQEELESEDEDQYRPANGYGELMRYLLDCFVKAGGILHVSTVIKTIKWQRGSVEITGGDNQIFTAKKAIITVPLGIWTAKNDEIGAITYAPALPEKVIAAGQMGFGAVIKILLCFKEILTENKVINKQADTALNEMLFALTDEKIKTWWTQSPVKSPLLTGWISGPSAAELIDTDEATILQMALESLSNILQIEKPFLKEKLLWHKVQNWTADPFSRGGYSYSTLHTIQARKILSAPVEQTLFFAGEALYDGPKMGTVEAALESGRKVANQILNLK